MPRLELSVALRDTDRTRALTDGVVRIDGVDPVYMMLGPEEIFFRAFRYAEFDISELSLSSFVVNVARGDCPYVGVPAFVSKTFRHASFYVRTDRIRKPEDLRGCRVGVPEYQLTAIVWARAILQDDHGVKPSDIRWIRGGMEEPGRQEKITIKLPDNVSLENAPEGRTLSGMLESGEIDAFIGPRAPSCFERGCPNVGWLFPEPGRAAADYFRRTGIFPIMHIIGVRATLAEKHPWLPAAVLKAFEQSKKIALDRLADTSSTKVALPFIEEQINRARELMGQDYWSYGVPANRKQLEIFLQHHHGQGLSSRLLKVEDLFHPATFEAFKL